jgi:hypothetical protein
MDLVKLMAECKICGKRAGVTLNKTPYCMEHFEVERAEYDYHRTDYTVNFL